MSPIISGGAGGGASADVTAECTLEANGPLDASGRALWDSIYDFGQNAVGAIPANMGLSLSVDTVTVTATEAGIWVFKLVMNPVADATAKARMLLAVPDYAGGPRVVDMDVSITPPLEWCLDWPCAMPVGGFVRVSASFSGATAPAYQPWSYGTLGITRVA